MLVENNNMSHYFERSDITVFVPLSSAYDNFLDEARNCGYNTNDRKTMEEILLYHIGKSQMCFTSLLLPITLTYFIFLCLAANVPNIINTTFWWYICLPSYICFSRRHYELDRHGNTQVCDDAIPGHYEALFQQLHVSRYNGTVSTLNNVLYIFVLYYIIAKTVWNV